MSKENVISKKEPFARMVKTIEPMVERPYQCGKSVGDPTDRSCIVTGSSGTCDRGSHKTESDRSVSWNY